MKTVQLVALVMLGCVVGARAETTNPKVDSLKRLLLSPHVTDRAEVLWNIAYELFDIDNPQAVFYAERAYQEVWAKGDSLQIVKVGTTYGQLLRRVGELSRSIEVASNMLLIARRHDFRKYRKMLLNSIGVAEMVKNEFDKALEHHYESLQLRQIESDSNGIIVALQNICLVHYRLNDLELAFSYAHQISRLLKNEFDTLLNTQALYLHGSIQIELANYDSAKLCLRKALLIGRNSSTYLSGHIDQCLGLAFLETGNLDSAEIYMKSALNLATKQQDKWVMSFAFLFLSEIALKREDIYGAYAFLGKAEEISRSVGYADIDMRLLLHRAKLNVITKKKDEAIALFRSYFEAVDSINNGRNAARIRGVQLAFHQRENNEKIKAQAGILVLQSEWLEQQRLFLIISLGLLTTAIFLSVELFRINQKVKWINRRLDQRVVERTAELELQRDELVHNREEQKVLMKRIYQELKSQINSISGLVNLAKIDRTGQLDIYLEQATHVLVKLNQVSQKLTDSNATRSPKG